MKHLFRILPPILLTLSFFTVSPVMAVEQSGHVSGNITSSAGSPLQDAFVNIFKVAKQEKLLSAGIRSNTRGFFRAANLSPGVYFLQVTRQGYQPVSSDKFEVEPNRTTTLNVTLQNLINFVSNEDDPRNWDFNTVLRSSSDRRMIFRYLPAQNPDTDGRKISPFYRNGTMSLASNTFLGNQQYLTRPQTSRNGVVTNFAFSEPLNRRSRMIFSGQFDFGRSSFWRVRDTIHYRPNSDHDYKVSFGYGRMNLDYPGKDSFESQLVSEEQDFGKSWVQTIAFGIEGTTKFYDMLEIHYGFDYSRLYYRENRSFIYPSLEIALSPSNGWCFTTTFTSRRESDRNSVLLSTGEVLNLSEPTLITVVGDNVSMSQVRHSEIELEKTVTQNTAIEVAVYRDNTYGPGIPLMVTTITPENQTSTVINLNQDRSSQQGMRITLNRKMLPNLRGSLAYVYGEATDISEVDESILIDTLNSNFREYARQTYHHAITGQIDASIPDTNTSLLATIHWYPGNPVSPIDWFSDPMDIGSKSLNFEIRQIIPIHDLLLNTGRWEILLDFRNVLNQGEDVISASDGILVLNRNPRSLRFGLSLNFQ